MIPAFAELILERSPKGTVQERGYRIRHRQLVIEPWLEDDRLHITLIFTGTKRYPPMRKELPPIEISYPAFDPIHLAERLGALLAAPSALKGFNSA
jgi:hypothetical protein